MSESKKENPQPKESEQKFHAIFSVMDFRAGHFPGSKTPPWLFGEMWKGDHSDWVAAVKKTDWKDAKEILKFLKQPTIVEKEKEYIS